MQVNGQNISPPIWMTGPHIETIYPAVFRKVNLDSPKPIRLNTPDGDFLDADFYYRDSKSIVILCHGLEGNSRRPYMLGMAKTLYNSGFDICAWNYRSCSGEVNLKPVFYHSGATYDLETIIDYIISTHTYERIFLLGFSLGGNLVLKYLGERTRYPESLKAALAISVPMDLSAGSRRISQRDNWLYEWRFMVNLKKKIRYKAKFMEMNTRALNSLRSLKDFDDKYTAPLHGFSDSEDYYARNSSRFFLEGIKLPTVILNSRNDTFLTPNCYPENNSGNTLIEWICPNRGGHVGFKNGSSYYSEDLATKYFNRFLI